MVRLPKVGDYIKLPNWHQYFRVIETETGFHRNSVVVDVGGSHATYTFDRTGLKQQWEFQETPVRYKSGFGKWISK